MLWTRFFLWVLSSAVRRTSLAPYAHAASHLAPPNGFVVGAFRLPASRSYVGNLSPDVTDALLLEIFTSLSGASVLAARVVRERATGSPTLFGFVDFPSQAHATAAFTLNGRILLGRDLRLNWAYRGAAASSSATMGHASVFVGDLSGEIDNCALYAAFLPYGALSDARVMWDPATGRSRGYGFLAFHSRDDADRVSEGGTG